MCKRGQRRRLDWTCPVSGHGPIHGHYASPLYVRPWSCHGCMFSSLLTLTTMQTVVKGCLLHIQLVLLEAFLQAYVRACCYPCQPPTLSCIHHLKQIRLCHVLCDQECQDVNVLTLLQIGRSVNQGRTHKRLRRIDLALPYVINPDSKHT